jgi:hypothetical protein
MPPSALYPTEYDLGDNSLSKSKRDFAFNNQDPVRGWPGRLTSALSWTGSDFVNEEQFVHELSVQDKAEIDNALAHFKGSTSVPHIKPGIYY